MKWLLYACLFTSLNGYAAESSTSHDWLKTLAFAGHGTDFSGDFVYQHDNQVETFRISHIVASDSEYEKVISLDGPKQEIIRHHGQTWCYRNHKMVQVASQQGYAKFPSRLLENVSDLNTLYRVQEVAKEQVAGYLTQVILLQSVDNLRYSHKIWLHSETGLLLKAAVLDEKKNVLEQYLFTQLKIGAAADRAWLASPQVDSKIVASIKTPALLDIKSGWVVDALPTGFVKVQEIKRAMTKKHAPVTQIVYSDGLSALSVFIEPTDDDDEDDKEGLSSRGSVNLYQKVVGLHLYTVVGEVPARTVMQVLDSIRFKGN
ncbi:MAG: MucB/RseB C-terminal domain-containing protein [Sideroxydans sp.]|nr:MucB/RseB C-terminal domain-containing protein [Sideroxydans sp.]